MTYTYFLMESWVALVQELLNYKFISAVVSFSRENLSLQAQAEVLKVMEGFTGGTCTRCREGDGCLSCSRWKATRYWLQKEGFSVDHLYGASGAALYQKSKLQREAQLAAYPMKVAEAPASRCRLQF